MKAFELDLHIWTPFTFGYCSLPDHSGMQESALVQYILTAFTSFYVSFTVCSPSIVDAKHTPTLRYHSQNISSYSSAVFSACLLGLEQFKCSKANHVTPYRYTIHFTGFDLVRIGICTTPPSHNTARRQTPVLNQVTKSIVPAFVHASLTQPGQEVNRFNTNTLFTV